MRKELLQRCCLWVSVAVVLLAAGTARADTITYNVTINTASLAPGNYTLAFALTDGSGTNDGNNTVTLSNFAFGGGSASNLSSGVTLNDSSFFPYFSQAFTAGNTLSFQLKDLFSLDTPTPSGFVPDGFAFYILDSYGNPIWYNGDPDLYAGLFTIQFDSNNPLPDNYSPGEVTLTAIPEPTSLALFGTGLLVGGGVLRRRMRLGSPKN